MFCRLHEVYDYTGIKLLDASEQCTAECQFYSGSHCSVIENVNIKLDSDKFGWRIDARIIFDDPIPSKSKNTYYKWMICLIHPSYSDVWIFKSFKSDEESLVYSIAFGNSQLRFDTLKEINEELKKQYYTGRLITDKDFNRRKK